MVADGFDIGIRVGQMAQPTLLARPIAPLPFVVVGAPSYFRTQGIPQHPVELAKHQCVCLRSSLAESTSVDSQKSIWRLSDFKNPTMATVTAKIISNDDSVVLASALQGQGLFYCALPLALPHLQRGELQVALPGWVGSGLTVFLHYPSRRNLPARVKLVVDFLLMRLRDHEDLQPERLKDLSRWTATA
jgi:DNA-binding transcriptional LysR family regulator